MPSKFLRLLSISWSINLQYRGDLMLWLIAITATPLLSLAVWYSVASDNAHLVPRDIFTYYLLVMFIRVTISSWLGFQVSQNILNGKIVNYLIRPPAILWEFVTQTLVIKVLQLMIPLPLLILSIIFKPDYFSPAIYQLNHVLLFILSLIVAALLTFFFDLSLGLFAFWLEDAHELISYRFLLMQVASGIIIPFSVMPAWLFNTFSLLPFRYTLSAPAEILLGQVSFAGAWQLIAIQAAWTIAFAYLLRILFIKGLKRYAIPGQ